MNVNGIEEVVADKGYHSGAVLQRVKSYEVRSYIPEKKQRGRCRWQGKREEQQVVYQNRRRVRGEYGKSLRRRRGELVERSFAHCYDTGGMRRTHLRGHKNILKRQLIHVGAFNLSLVLRQLLGAGTPREWRNRGGLLLLLIYCLRPPRKLGIGHAQPEFQAAVQRTSRHGWAERAAGRAGNQLLTPQAASQINCLRDRLGAGHPKSKRRYNMHETQLRSVVLGYRDGMTQSLLGSR